MDDNSRRYQLAAPTGYRCSWAPGDLRRLDANTRPVSTAPPNWPTYSVSLAPLSTAPSNATRQPPDGETADAVPQKHQCRALDGMILA